MKDSINNWWREHSSVVITVAVVILVDHLVFKGTFRKKIESLVDRFLNKAEKQIESN